MVLEYLYEYSLRHDRRERSWLCTQQLFAARSMDPWLLHVAARDGRATDVATLLSLRYDVNRRTEQHGNSPVSYTHLTLPTSDLV